MTPEEEMFIKSAIRLEFKTGQFFRSIRTEWGIYRIYEPSWNLQEDEIMVERITAVLDDSGGVWFIVEFPRWSKTDFYPPLKINSRYVHSVEALPENRMV